MLLSVFPDARRRLRVPVLLISPRAPPSSLPPSRIDATVGSAFDGLFCLSIAFDTPMTRHGQTGDGRKIDGYVNGWISQTYQRTMHAWEIRRKYRSIDRYLLARSLAIIQTQQQLCTAWTPLQPSRNIKQ